MSDEFIAPKQNHSIVLLSSDEPLLLRDYLDKTRAAFREAGYDDIQTYSVEQGFDWQAQSSTPNMSLFSTQSLKIYQFFSSKPGVAGAKAITELCERANLDERIILLMPKLDAKAKNAAWCKQLKKYGQVIELKPIYANQLVGWVMKRAQEKKLDLSPDAGRFLADRTEGNLLATDQELEKLALLHGEGEHLSLQQVAHSVANQARYSHFELADCCLAGDRKKAIRILKNQQAEGVANLTLMNLLKTNLELISRVKHAAHNAQMLNGVWTQARVWESKKSLYLQAANRLSVNDIDGLIQQCALIDRMEKGQQRNFPQYVKLKPMATDLPALEMLELVNNFSGNK